MQFYLEIFIKSWGEKSFLKQKQLGVVFENSEGS